MSATLAVVLANVPERQRTRTYNLAAMLTPLLGVQRGITKELKRLAVESGIPYKTLERKFYELRRKGTPAVLVDKRHSSALWKRNEPVGLSEQDAENLCRYVENNQRKSAPAIRAFLRDWREGKIHTDTPVVARTGYPRGWSKANLMRHISSRFILKAARQGRQAARSETRLVYTTRANLWIGSHYLFDDLWHDLYCNNLDTLQAGRPLEFHALDLFTANKFAWGTKIRLERQDGTMEGLNEREMRSLLAYVLRCYGYSLRGTTLVVEHGTAAIRPEVEAMLHDFTNGLITVERGSIKKSGLAAAAHQYAGRTKGNFCIKAALESYTNLIHNETAFLPGQTGMDIAHRPEQTHGLLKENDALLKAISQLHPEQIELLHLPLLTIQQFRFVLNHIYANINARTEHSLEGWDMNYVFDRRTARMRKMAPVEVWNRDRRHLVQVDPRIVAAILWRDNAPRELTVRSGMLLLKNGEITGDVLRFDARSAGLDDRRTYACVLNPYYPREIYAYDSAGRFVAAAERIESIDRADTEAIMREVGKARAVEAKALEPFRRRHAAAAKQRSANMRHNAQVLTATTPADQYLQKVFNAKVDILLDECSDAEAIDIPDAILEENAFNSSILLDTP